MKTPTACRECRLGKRKCTPPTDSTSVCRQCQRRKVPCSLTRLISTRGTSQRALIPRDTFQDRKDSFCPPSIPNAETRVELGKLYVTLIHDKPHTLFHPPTLLRQLEEESLAPKVMYGVFAMSSRYVSPLVSEIFTCKQSFCGTYTDLATGSRSVRSRGIRPAHT